VAKQILPPFKFVDSVSKDIYNAGDDKGLEITGSIPLIGKLAYWHLGRGTTKRDDIWEIRFRKHKASLREIKEKFDQSPDKQAFAKKYREELAEYHRSNKFQGKLNNLQKVINTLKSQGTDSANKRIRQLEERKTELTKSYLERDR